MPDTSPSSTRLAHQNSTLAIASDFCIDGAKSPEIPQKEGVLGPEIATRNHKSLASFLRTLKSQCKVSEKTLAISGVCDGHRNRKSQKSLRFRCAKSTRRPDYISDFWCIPCPSFPFFVEKGRENHAKKNTRIFYPYRNPKSPGKEEENAQNNKEILEKRRKKQGIPKKNKERKDRVFIYPFQPKCLPDKFARI